MKTKIPDNIKDLAKLEKFITTRAKRENMSIRHQNALEIGVKSQHWRARVVVVVVKWLTG